MIISDWPSGPSDGQHLLLAAGERTANCQWRSFSAEEFIDPLEVLLLMNLPAVPPDLQFSAS
jgi:hypothetical protein